MLTAPQPSRASTVPHNRVGATPAKLLASVTAGGSGSAAWSSASRWRGAPGAIYDHATRAGAGSTWPCLKPPRKNARKTMAERSFKQEVKKLRLGADQEFRGEGILALT